MAARLIIGNWKMYVTHTQAVAWMHNHRQELARLAQETVHTLVLCPSYESITPLIPLISNKCVHIGAQDCSAYEFGAYSGQVSAQSIKELGATYTLVGHSETRVQQKGTNELTVLKTAQAFAHNLIPIVCIGETKEKYQAGTTLNVIEEQIRPILELYAAHQKPMALAYEPIWAIGTHQVPDKAHLEKVYDYIIKKCARMGIERVPQLLYGGSVDEVTIHDLAKITNINGFLIGKASTDFQKFKKIVKSI